MKNNTQQASKRTGILIVNLGTPDALGYFALRRYLKEFLSDPRVVEKNRFVWWCILNIILLSFIPFRSSRNYAKIWNKELNESPLRTITRATAEKLAHKLSNPFGESMSVEWAMRYGTPNIEEKMTKMRLAGCTKIVVLPLYPQYSAVTTASVYDAVFDTMKKMRWMPSIRMIDPYYDHPTYIETISNSIRQHLSDRETQPEKIVLSYHGLPKANLEKGDPYYCHCRKTSRLIAENLGMDEETVITTFQSRFGREEWLKPYTDITLEELAQSGTKDICILTPGFSADCVETLEEIAIQNKETFLGNGGKTYTFIPCLNDSDEGINLYNQLLDENLEGWKGTKIQESNIKIA